MLKCSHYLAEYEASTNGILTWQLTDCVAKYTNQQEMRREGQVPVSSLGAWGQHPAAGSARSQLQLRPSQHSLKTLLDVPSQNHCETSKKSTKWSLLYNNRATEHSSKKYESFLIPFFCLVLFKYVPRLMALSHNFGVKHTPLLKSIPKSPTQ